ncbi:MAG: KEOPS complex subunit Cgi121 [Candidatus Odinarchaeia archaeon]
MISKKFDKPFENYGVTITAFKRTENTKLSELIDLVGSHSAFTNKPIIQLFNADRIATWKHLYFAAYLTLQNYHSAHMKSKTIELELMRLAAAKRHIKDAIDMLGLNENTKRIAFLSITIDSNTRSETWINYIKKLELTPELKLLNLTDEKVHLILKLFNIPEIEYNILSRNYTESDKYELIVKLVINRMASTVLKK